MIFIDFSQVSICAIQKGAAYLKTPLDHNLCRHLALNGIRQHVHKFKRTYGSVVVACDSKNYWRKDIFPYYKIKRSEKRDKSNLDWPMIYGAMDEIKVAIKDHFPYKLLTVARVEADDIIGTLAPRIANIEPVLIVSSDGDYKQLQEYENIKQYSPQTETFVSVDNPHKWLKEKVIKGDHKDGVTNILSPIDSIATGTRQKAISEKLLNEYMGYDFSDSSIPNYDAIQRNLSLLSFKKIPKEIKSAIIEEYNKEQSGNKRNVLRYLMSIQSNLIQDIQDF